MKTLQLFLTAMLLLGLTTAAVAQNIFAPTMSGHLSIPMGMLPDTDEHREFERSPTVQLALATSMKHSLLSSWTGDGTSQFITDKITDEDFMESFGISEEQSRTIFRAPSGEEEQTESDRQRNMEKQQLYENTPGGLFAMDTPEEAQMKYAELNLQTMDCIQRVKNEVIYKTLTPDQIKTIREYQIATMSETILAPSSMFEALDLSDEQKKQLDDVKMKLKPEFDKIADKYLAREVPNYQASMKRSATTDPDEKEKIRKELEEIWKDVPKLDEILESSKKLSNELKIEMFDVLTDEQWERFQKLVDDPPDYIKKIVARLHKQDSDGAKPSTPEAWAPGPNSWKPGDPIPEGYRQQRQTRGNFPRPTGQQQNKGAEQ